MMYRDGLQRKNDYLMRVRTLEFAEQQRVGLLDANGIGVATLRWLHSVGLRTADQIMQTPTDEIINRIADSNPFPSDPRHARVQVEIWKRGIRTRWREVVDEPFPSHWLPEDAQSQSRVRAAAPFWPAPTRPPSGKRPDPGCKMPRRMWIGSSSRQLGAA